MRILHIITRMILGGAQENTLLSVIGQMEAGHDVRLLTGPTTGPEGSLLRDAKASSVDLVEADSLVRSLSPLRDCAAWRVLRRQIREYKPDVVHTHSSKAGFLGRLAAWQERAPFVVHTIHGLPFHPYQGLAANRLYVAAEQFAAKRCHRIVSVADAMTRQAVAAGVAPACMFETVYSGMRMEPFLDDGRDVRALRETWGIAESDIVIGKIARLFELKGHEYLLQTFARLLLENERLLLFLVGDGVRREELRALARKLGVAHRIVWAGLVPHEHIPDAIACMDIVVHCSLREGLARVLPQALLSAKPVVSFDIDGACEAVVDGETGRLVPPGDTEALTEAISAMLFAPDEAARMAQRGRELCRKRFDWRNMVGRLLDIYRNGTEGCPESAESARFAEGC